MNKVLPKLHRQLDSHIKKKVILSNREIRKIANEAHKLKQYKISHSKLDKVFEQLELIYMKDQPLSVIRAREKSKAESELMSCFETPSIDGNIANNNQDGTFQNSKTKERGETTLKNLQMKTNSQTTEEFPLELLTNQNFDIVHEGLSTSQTGYTENLREATSTLEAIVNRLTPLIISQSTNEDLENSVNNQEEITDYVRRFNNETCSSETQDHDGNPVNKNFEVVDTNNESFVFVINESGKTFNTICQTDLPQSPVSDILTSDNGKNEIKEKNNTEEETNLIIVKNAILECLNIKNDCDRHDSTQNFKQTEHTDIPIESHSFSTIEINKETLSQNEKALASLECTAKNKEEQQNLAFDINNSTQDLFSQINLTDDIPSSQPQTQSSDNFSTSESNVIILQHEINSIRIYVPDIQDSFQLSQEQIIQKISKKKAKWMPKWNSLSNSEKVSGKFVEKFGIKIFDEPVNALLHMDRQAKSSVNPFFRSTKDLEKCASETEKLQGFIEEFSETIKKLKLLDITSNSPSDNSQSDSSDTEDEDYARWNRNYRKTTKRAYVREKYNQFLE